MGHEEGAFEMGLADSSTFSFESQNPLSARRRPAAPSPPFFFLIQAVRPFADVKHVRMARFGGCMRHATTVCFLMLYHIGLILMEQRSVKAFHPHKKIVVVEFVLA